MYVLIFIILLVMLSQYNGFYNPVLHTIYCTDKASCLHEIGHKLDHEKGWISQTEEYRHSIDVYRAMLWAYPEKRDEHSFEVYQYPGLGSLLWQNGNPLTWSFWNGGWGGYGEFYADVIAWSDGDPNKCPQDLRGWYDWNFINSEMENLRGSKWQILELQNSPH